MRLLLPATLAFLLLAAGCARKHRATTTIPRPPGPAEVGQASWYGYPYHGRRAANGEIYDMEKLTAAHRTLAFGTWVRVQNLDNQKTVDVKITDRGPFARNRIIDLSRAAARRIDMLGPGTAPVKLTIIAAAGMAPAEPESTGFAVQVGAFAERRNAERLRATMAHRYGAARLVQRDTNGGRWRVLVGQERTEESAQALAERIRAESKEAGEAFVVRVDQTPVQ